MEQLGKPVPEYLEKLDKLIREVYAEEQPPVVDLSDTSIAFESKSDEELRKAYYLFRMMNYPWLVKIGSALALWGIRMRLSFVEKLILKTVFPQFVGGRTLRECIPTIEKLWQYGVYSVLDYGVEGKETEEDFNHTMNENLRALEFAARQESVPVVSTKLTGMARFQLLADIQAGKQLTPAEEEEWQNVRKRVDAICHAADRLGVKVFIDAEESWIQDPIDELVNEMMARYNKGKVVVYNTFQMYRRDRLDYLIASHERARKEGWMLGAKLVRGAYMEKERERAAEMGYPDPIHPTKEATDRAYDTGIAYCVEHYEEIASVNASHNARSARLQAELIVRKNLPRRHAHLNFCQLYGMSDHITFNLAKAGFNVAKYVPYGAVRDVIPYLIRRAQENTSVTGDMSRELALIVKEMNRRADMKR
ncbi:MAG: proline dehydrogenase [Bacteroidetes bacterium]|nr:MAG: proline dehydrogenase [Bacteroidota bacterium]